MAKKSVDTISTELEKLMDSYKYKTGADYISVLGDLIDYIIGYFDPDGNPVNGWNHTKEENEEFYKMMIAYLSDVENKVGNGWYDAWGDLIMSLRTKGGGFEQYFTPPSVCEFMVRALSCETKEYAEIPGIGKRVVISDPSCGSSRNLIAAHTKMTTDGNKAPYLIGEDIDVLCCKISAVNMAIHGAVGEVVCHDSLSEPTTIRAGWLINHRLYSKESDMPIPDIVRSNDTDKFVCVSMWQKSTTNKYQQLSLF